MIIMLDRKIVQKALWAMANRQQWEDEYTEAHQALKAAYEAAIGEDEDLLKAVELMRKAAK